MFDNKKVLKPNFKFLKRYVDTGTFKYCTNSQNDFSAINQTFRALKYNFQASLIQLSKHSLHDLSRSGHFNKKQNL